MADLSDPRIQEAYTEIEQYQDTNWLLLGYNDTRDVISLYSKGEGGLSEFRNHLSDEVLYGFVRVEDRFILITWVSEQVSGVRRARALVHSRAVASLLKSHHAQITASSMNDLSDNNIRTRLKIGENQVPNRSRPSSMSERKRSSMSSNKRQSTQQSIPPSPQPNPQRESTMTDEPESFVEASDEFPTSPVTPTAPTSDEQQQQQQQQQQEENKPAEADVSRQQQEEQKKQAAIAAARERARVEEEERMKKAEQEAQARAEQEARVKKQREQEELKRQQMLKAQEEEKKKKAEAEKRQREEQQAMQRRMQEAEKNKDVLLVGYASIQPSTSPFWRRRYLEIRGKSLVLYRDELAQTPVTVIDLKSVTRLSGIDQERETFLPNAFVLDTQKDGSYQLCADNNKGRQTIFTALQTVTQTK
ncbi:hypothetical protein LRAMOSA01027 [Lichtheimia ramosa]|uniref:ADF-H domain-containing protein n=1 Tax=Lichtheimia ramosa TaxID=688394 RepID=A0A077WA46_9FUNG|nr:hypothetical protein LRAMOSA01027 [Lichtheimia ramosa]